MIKKIISLEAHVEQLQNVIKGNRSFDGEKKSKEPHPKKARIFNFAKYKVRHVALKLMYLGWDYQGFVVQEDTNKTIESVLFDALLKTKLIHSRESSNYHRCGRTDKGVTAFAQVISLDLRTNLIEGKGVITPENYEDTRTNNGQTEIPYATILNKVLPPEVRIIAWAPVDEKFSARFNCQKRTYKYLFPIGDMNIDLMKQACKYLIGEHDFRNLCKMAVNNGVLNYKRTIFSAEINCTEENHCYSMCELTIIGQAFLWHQIRCIVAILFLVGEGKEQPEIIEKLLNIEICPNKPQYCMAAEFPLILFDCQYSDHDIEEWQFENQAIIDLVKHLQMLWSQQEIKANMIKLMLNNLKMLYQNQNQNQNDSLFDIKFQAKILSKSMREKVYKPLFERPFCGK